MPKNNAKKWMIIAVIFTLIGAAVTYAGFALDKTDTFWMIPVGLVLAITFLICIFVFASQSRRLERMFKHEELLARWTFDMAQQQQKAEAEFKARKKSNRILILIVIAFFVIIGGLFTAFGFDDLEDAAGFLLVMLGMMILICIAAWIAPIMSYRKMRNSQPEVYVGPYGAWVLGEYVQWKAPMTRPIQVVFEPGQAGAQINVQYEIFQRYGYQQHDCRIPSPPGCENEAFSVANKIAEANNVNLSVASA